MRRAACPLAATLLTLLALAAGVSPAGAVGLRSCPTRPGGQCALVADGTDGWQVLTATEAGLVGTRVALSIAAREAGKAPPVLVANGRCPGKVVWLEYGERAAAEGSGGGLPVLYGVGFRGAYDATAGYRPSLTPDFPC